MRPPLVLTRPAGEDQRVRLLIVEDDPSTVLAMREFFSQTGYEVDAASALAEATDLLDRRSYDAVITDLHLTTQRFGEGMKVAWHARLSHPHACIVMLTGYAADTTEEEAYRCGVDMYQMKPVELPLVGEFIALAVDRGRHCRSHQELEPRGRRS